MIAKYVKSWLRTPLTKHGRVLGPNSYKNCPKTWAFPTIVAKSPIGLSGHAKAAGATTFDIRPPLVLNQFQQTDPFQYRRLERGGRFELALDTLRGGVVLSLSVSEAAKVPR